jgi:hypothetical protein
MPQIVMISTNIHSANVVTFRIVLKEVSSILVLLLRAIRNIFVANLLIPDCKMPIEVKTRTQINEVKRLSQMALPS